MMTFELNTWLRAELVRRLNQEEPEEACGLISAPRHRREGKWATFALWGAENASEEPETSFLIDPRAQTSILEQIWKRGEDLVGVYHSHPRSKAEPSERDREIAARQPFPLTWVIVGKVACPNCDGPVGDEVPAELLCTTCAGAGAVPDFWLGLLP